MQQHIALLKLDTNELQTRQTTTFLNEFGNGVINSPEAWDDKNNVSVTDAASIELFRRMWR